MNKEQNISAISDKILSCMPQKPPFKFLDRIIRVDEQNIEGQYTFREDEWFYRGHFSFKPVTPGVIIIEAMAQAGVVAFGVYLFLKECGWERTEDISQFVTLFADVEAQFHKEVPPSETVTIKAEKVFWRRRKLRVNASLFLANGELASTALLSGVGVER